MPSPSVRIRLLNRQMGHHSGPVVLKGHSGKVYGGISRFSPPDNCHAVELTLAQYEAARADLFKAMRLHARRIWEVAVVVELPIETDANAEARLRAAIRYELGDLDDTLIGMDTGLPISRESVQAQIMRLRKAIGPLEGAVSSAPGASVDFPILPLGTQKFGPGIPTNLPPVDDKTPWNALLKIAKEWGVDLKVHKNRESIMEALRGEFAKAAPVAPASASSPPHPPATRRVLRQGSEQHPKTLDVVFFAEVVEDEALFASSHGQQGIRTVKTPPLPCRDKEERQAAQSAFAQLLAEATAV